MNAVHFVVPEGIDDPRHPSGGNIYDRRLADGLRDAGWSVHEYSVPGDASRTNAAIRQGMARVFSAVPDGAMVLIDGLTATAAPEVLVRATRRLPIVVLLHMPFGEATPALRDAERKVLTGATAVITTSAWTRAWVCAHYALPQTRVHVATPGVDGAALATSSAEGNKLLCVAAVSRLKGHDVLVAALGSIRDLAWQCRCVGPMRGEPQFVADLQRAARANGVDTRMRLAGPLRGAELASAYAASDVLVLASRREAYGMVIGEALARGLPVIATRVGGVTEALGDSDDGEVAGLLVAPDSTTAFAAALRKWLTDAALRQRLRVAAAGRRARLLPWSVTIRSVAGVLVRAVA